jgi:outer membrane scaffolding protein for murein synthesis (MipA/OmpV family)
MVRRLKFYTGLIGLIGVVINTPSLAEQSVQVGLVTSVNSGFYKDVGEEYYVLPLVIAEYDRFYLQGTHGGYRFFQDNDGQSLALEIRHTFDGYRSDDNDALASMADRDAAWEAGLAYEVNMAGGQIKTKLMQDISDTHNGFSARFEYERPYWIDDALIVSWYTGSEYWNGKKSNYYFGVTPEEAMPTRSVYAPDENYSFYLGSNVFKRIDDNITLIVSAEYLRMSDAAYDSPLTNRKDQWSAYAGVFYQF